MIRNLFAVALSVLVAFSGGVGAQGYPDRTVKLVVGFPPGGTNDVIARLIAAKLQERFKQTFVVENKPGAASMIAAESVAKSPADGYTLLVAPSGALTINPAIYSKVPYDPVADFAPVALLGSFPLVVTVNNASPLKDLKGMVEASRKAASGLNHGVGSSTFQLAAEVLSKDSGAKFTHVNYKGSAATANALLTGEIDIAVIDIAPVAPLIRGGKLRALAVSTAKRAALLPEVPTVGELGIKGYDISIWTGLVTPKGTPESVI
ncbi:MAG: Bug family tripartite tricarboxylate transporter substrate binding protein, partial [Burkholderiales bacterium]